VDFKKPSPKKMVKESIRWNNFSLSHRMGEGRVRALLVFRG
jgi:hypothetical protein